MSDDCGTKVKITGIDYYFFKADSKQFFITCDAFEAESKNPKLDYVNKELSKAATNCNSVSVDFLYNARTSKKGYSHAGAVKSHTHYIWEITKYTATGGFSGDSCAFVRLEQKYADQVFINYCPITDTILACGTDNCSTYPKFTVSTTPLVYKDKAVGYFTDFELVGKGIGKKSLELEDYMDIFGGTVGIVGTVMSFEPTVLGVCKLISGGWSFYSKSSEKNKSTEYTSGGKKALSYTDPKTGVEYYAHDMRIKSPIKLQSKGDYLEAHIYMHGFNSKPNSKQSINIKIGL